jgi:hypothetical protein
MLKMFKQHVVNLNSDARIATSILINNKDIVSEEAYKKAKKIIKKMYKNQFPVRKKRYPKHFINQFRFVDESGENATVVIIFENKKGVMEGIHANLNVEGDSNYYDYSPTGLWFADRAKIYEFEERIVYVQRSSLDC